MLEKLKNSDLDNWRVVLLVFIVAPSFVWIPIVARFAWRRIQKLKAGKQGQHCAAPVSDSLCFTWGMS
jgi:hypothetical protein